MSDSCIQVSNLGKTYKDITAVNDISFEVQKGEILGILGPNGSGKTTTMKSILGLIEFDSGEIHVNEMSIQKERKRIIADVGAILEGARNIYWHLSPRENLAYFAGIRGLSFKAVKERADYLLENLGLIDDADKEIREFSAGMKQKSAMACAFIHDPAILLLDEPTLGLDVEISRTIRNWLTEVVKNEKKTILITSHNMDFVESTCNRILIIRNGEIISHETLESLKEKFARKFFKLTLDMEPSTSLLDSLDSIGDVSREGSTVRISLENANQIFPLVDVLKKADVNLKDFRTEENDLEEIFLEVIREKTQ